MPSEFTLLVESWRQVSHSYALVNQFQCLGFLRTPGLRLLHRDVPYLAKHWTACPGLFQPQDEALLHAIPEPTQDSKPDAVLRLAFPYDFTPRPDGAALFVFGTAENGTSPAGSIAGCDSPLLPVAMERSGAQLITPSKWCKEGFVNDGAPPDRVHVVPHGVDIERLHPLPIPEKLALRTSLGMAENQVVFLNIGSLTPNKGVLGLLRAFLPVARAYPEARLLLKFNGALYSADHFRNGLLREFKPSDQALLSRCVTLNGAHLSNADLARLYQAADAYVAPYFAEGFNLPALEACACGLPVIATAGGPTDEFLPPTVLHPIASRKIWTQREGRKLLVLDPDLEDLALRMETIITDPAACAAAREHGPSHVRGHYQWHQVVQRLVALLRGGSAR